MFASWINKRINQHSKKKKKKVERELYTHQHLGDLASALFGNTGKTRITGSYDDIMKSVLVAPLKVDVVKGSLEIRLDLFQ